MVAEDCATRLDASSRKRGATLSHAGEAAVKRENRATTPCSAQPAGWALATIKDGGKRAKPEAPKFLLLLYEILKVEDASIIRWSEDGLALQILDPVVVTEKILPKYFNHTNFHSFQRQLNYFGFRKWTKSKTDICTFSHPYFRQNQPELLQVIKRKKAPRRSASGGGKAGAAKAPAAGAEAAATSQAPTKKTQSGSPCGKRKLPVDSSSEGFNTQGTTGMHIQMNTSAVHIQPAINGVAPGVMTTPHASSSSSMLGFSSQDGLPLQYLPGSTLLNNVISPVAATECKKKAKKMGKKEYLASATLHAPLASPTDSAASHISSSSGLSMNGTVIAAPPGSNSSVSSSNTSCVGSDTGSSHSNGFTATTLPTLDIVRNRIIRRQQADASEQHQHQALQQQQQHRHQQFEYNNFQGFGAPSGSQGFAVPTFENRPDLLTQGLPTPVPRSELNAGFLNSFSDPVDILLRIKKSRTSSGEGKDAPMGQELINDQDALHNFLLRHSLYTNRLQSQLKIVLDENESLKHTLNAKQREMDNLRNDQKALQHENAVLLEDKNKLFEINRDLLGKLFPQ